MSPPSQKTLQPDVEASHPTIRWFPKDLVEHRRINAWAVAEVPFGGCFHFDRLFHGLNLRSALGSKFDQSPSKVIARSSIVIKAAGLDRTKRTSSNPQRPIDSYHKLPA